MFIITEKVIDSGAELKKLKDYSVGGLVVFEGRVRNHNEGREVLALDYEIYPEMAIKEGGKIINEAKEMFDIKYAKCIHRFGELKLGDIAVLVIACSKHRKESFLACEYMIDKLKQEVPVWKKEHYISGPSKWIACHRCSEAQVQ